MKWKLTKDEFEKLDDAVKAEYTLDGDAATLKIDGEGAPTVEAIDRANEKLRIEKEHRVKAEKARDAAESASEKLKVDLDKASGKDEIAKIKADHQAELEKIRKDREAEQTAARDARHAALKKEAAEGFANEHFTIPGLMIGPFANRLSVEEVDGESVVRVLSADGKASAMSLAELQREFLDNAEYATIIKKKTGSGGGAAPGGGGGATSKKLSEMTATEEAKFEREDPEGYKVAVAAEAPGT